MGVIPPSEEEFSAAKGNPVMHNVSSPTEGIVVLEPPQVLVPPDTQEYVTESLGVSLQENSLENSSTKQKRKSKKTEDV